MRFGIYLISPGNGGRMQVGKEAGTCLNRGTGEEHISSLPTGIWWLIWGDISTCLCMPRPGPLPRTPPVCLLPLSAYIIPEIRHVAPLTQPPKACPQKHDWTWPWTCPQKHVRYREPWEWCGDLAGANKQGVLLSSSPKCTVEAAQTSLMMLGDSLQLWASPNSQVSCLELQQLQQHESDRKVI